VPAIVSFVDTTGHRWSASVILLHQKLPPPEYRYVLIPSILTCLMADQYFKDTARTTDSIEATGSMASSASPPGLANKSLSSDASATAMAKFSLDLRDLEAAAVLEALGRVPETQWPVTEASTLEMSTDSEVTFCKVLGSSEILATRPGVDPLEVTRPLADVSWTSQSPQATSPSVLIRQPTRTSPGPWPSVASHVFGPSTTQVDPDRESRQTTNWHHTEDPGSLHWFPHHESTGSAVQSDVCNVSQGTIWPTVGISSNVIAPSGAVDVDVRTQRPSQQYFVAGDTRKFLPIHVDVHDAPSSCVDIHPPNKRLYAAAHAPLAPPTTPVADLLCRKRDILSSSSDSDYPPASQRENRPPLLGTRLRSPSGSSDLSTATGTDALKQSLQLTTQLAVTVQQQLERTQNEASQREQRMFNDIAEREHRLLVDAADREQRLLSVAAERDRRTRDEYADREHALMKEAASVRDALLAHDQREIEAERGRLLDDVQQRERDLRRDMYDLAAQRSHAAALEAELKCLKANIGPPTVAYEVIDVPVQSADIPPPDVDTAMQMPSSRPVSPIDSIVVQGLSAGIIQRQPPVSIVNRPDTAHTLTSNPNATDTSAECGYRAAGMSTLQPPFLSSEMHEPTAQYIPPQQFNPGFTYQSDTPSRRPEYTFSRSASAVTSMLPCRPAYMPTRTPTVPPPVDDVVISALPRPPAVPVDDHVVTSALPRPPIAPGSVLSIDNTMQRPVDRVDSSNLYANSAERLLAELPPPPHVHTQPILPLSSEYTQTTASEYVNTDSVPSLTAHTYADYSQHLPIAVGEPGLSAFSRVDALQNQPIAVDPTVQYVVSRSASADNVRPTVIPHIAPLQSPSIHWRKQFAYDYIQPDTGLGASTHAAPAVHSGYIRPQTSDTHTHTN